jgi:hypothetical protein
VFAHASFNDCSKGRKIDRTASQRGPEDICLCLRKTTALSYRRKALTIDLNQHLLVDARTFGIDFYRLFIVGRDLNRPKLNVPESLEVEL